jgi:hypothetical protein
MNKFSLLLIMFCSQSVYAGDCALEKEGKYTNYSVKSWTGDCTSEIVSGDGKGVFINNIIKNANLGDGEEIFVGRFSNNNSFINGVVGPAYQVTKSGNNYSHALYFNSKPGLGLSVADNDENGKPFVYLCFQKSNVLSRSATCSQIGSNNQISFDEAVNRLYQFSNKKNIQSMDKETFLSLVIEADYKKDLAKRELMKDDPPVAGITLSLGDDAKPSKKSKKKN